MLFRSYRLWSEGAVNWRKSETIEDSDISDVPENAEKSAEARIYEGFPDATAKIRRDRFRKASSIDERLACLPLGDDRLDEFCVRLMIEWGSDLDRIQSRFSGRRDAFDRGVSSMQSLFDEPAPAAPEPTPAACSIWWKAAITAGAAATNTWRALDPGVRRNCGKAGSMEFCRRPAP